MNKYRYLLAALLLFSSSIYAQQVTLTKDQIISMTSEWKGERLPDGRPKVSDDQLERLKNISIEEAWGILRNKGYHNQFEGDWMIMDNEKPMTGRALTVQYMPARSDYHEMIMAKGKAENRIGNFNSWPIDMLKPGDIYVADSYGKIVDGTLIGDNLGNSIYAKSKNGVIFYGSVRDEEGLAKIDGFNMWVKGYDPSYIQGMMLGGINVPIRIGRATVLPGDAVLAKKGGVIFIPAHLLADLLINAEFIALRDQFGHQRLREGRFTPGQIDQRWTDEIKNDFLKWLDANPDKIPMSRAELDAYMKDRTW
ncbi:MULTISPECIES: RraA family protein [unclassified Imperialibacter]|uniref:RraA family protein n=1 Tax=unclassified Imperialibacter TaxID=2629706 RepID=UPI001251B78D|nr:MULTISPECIES: RraA family protein [unclassified Imperialibacter]CAD5278704.1 Dimethylmenaquinone methyltransferase [Imperialibacter sp. 89]CAD5292853.1 Dimethylmenaquinone methyltransferase [Imperialibacter sp. 75]VVS99385.1 Regulator of RNase E activity RraA [Imperialibacter sp. EC-SDR9]